MQINVWKIRTQKGLSLRELAKRSGVSKTHIDNIESGKTMPTIDIICKIAKALEVDPRELYDYDK
ncbi:MAG: helix-turn-helix transcriptional regulator [Bacillota bacterium]|nr:helix-turn-helix transcriptional regulator [Bacillota bacterium]